MAAATTESSEDAGEEMLSWRSSWTVSGGSIRDTICLESSDSILKDVDEGGAVSVSGGLLLTKPAGRESDPCEITVCFRERHEIHQVYVRSTARVYEIYYGLEEKDGDEEYLCTVRCGATEKEVFLPRVAGEEEQRKNNSSSSSEVPGKSASTSGEEDGWVEVKVPESPDTKDMIIKANGQIYFEATAEISDASPCRSLKLRLLSLQSSEWIHIEEIYIYADPVEPSDCSPSLSKREDMSGSPLLAMLVPGMLQLSKAGGGRLHDTGGSPRSTYQSRENNATARAEETKIAADRAEKDNENPLLERKLDELITRVGKMESFFARFEESIMKPLCSIDIRLQRVEQQLDAISSRSEFQSDPSYVNEEHQMVNDMEVVSPNGDNPVMSAADGGGSSLSDSISPSLPKEEEKTPISIDDVLTSALEAFILSGAAANSDENKMDSDPDRVSPGITVQVKDEISDKISKMDGVDLPSTPDFESSQQDEEGSTFIQSSIDAAEDVDLEDNQVNMHQSDDELRTDIASVSGDNIEGQSKEEAQKTLTVFLDGILEVDSQRVPPSFRDESILDVKFTRHEELEDVFHFGPDGRAGDDACLVGHGTGWEYGPGSSDTEKSLASAAGEGLLIDLEFAADNLAAEGSHEQQPSSSLI